MLNLTFEPHFQVHTWAFVYPILFNVQSTETVLDMTCGHVDTSSQSQPFLSEEPSLLVTTVEVLIFRRFGFITLTIL